MIDDDAPHEWLGICFIPDSLSNATGVWTQTSHVLGESTTTKPPGRCSTLSICPSINFCSVGPGHRGSIPSREAQTSTSFSSSLRCVLRPRSPVRHAWNTSSGRCPGSSPNQMPELPQLAPLDVEEQWLHSKSHLVHSASHPNSFQLLVFAISFFQSLHTICDCNWGSEQRLKDRNKDDEQSLAFWLNTPFTTTDPYRVRITRDVTLNRHFIMVEGFVYLNKNRT